jgi:hypothetical protein
LAVNVVLHIAGSEHAADIGCCCVAGQSGLGFNVTAFHVQLAYEQFRIGLVTNRNECTHDRDIFFAAVLLGNANTGNAFLIT